MTGWYIVGSFLRSLFHMRRANSEDD